MKSSTTPKSTFATESPAGPTPLASPGGQQIDLLFQFPALASPSPSPAKDSGPQTTGTFGRISPSSSASVMFNAQLASRLRQRLDVNGSPEYKLTWKEWVLLSGLRICALRAQARHTSDSAYTGWRSPDSNKRGGAYTDPQKVLDRAAAGHQTNLEDQETLTGWRTPAAADADRGVHPNPDKQAGEHSLTNEVQKTPQPPAPILPPNPQGELTGWPTPRAEDSEQTGAHRGVPDTLTSATKLTGWPTVSSRDWKDSPGMATTGTNPDGSTRSRLDQLPRVASLTGWSTPQAGDEKWRYSNPQVVQRRMDAGKQISLEGNAQMAGWSTPTAQDHSRGSLPPRPQDTGVPLSQQVAEPISGPTTPSSPASTANRGALNPAFARWLQSYPKEWCEAAIRAYRLIPKRRQKRA